MKIRFILTTLIVLTLLTNIMSIYAISEKTNVTIYVDDGGADYTKTITSFFYHP